jgi:hypothetical protein
MELISIRFVFVKLLLNGSTVVAASIYFRRELLRMLHLSTKIDDASFNLIIFLIISTNCYRHSWNTPLYALN